MNERVYKSLSKRVIYDKVTGGFIWISPKTRSLKSGSKCGSKRNGYIIIKYTFSGEQYTLLAHRLAWYISTGEIPKMIDHIDGDGRNNSLSNLREVTAKQNRQNNKTQTNNSTGFTGVHETHNGRYRAVIQVEYRQISLGYYNNIEDAIQSRKEAEIKYFNEYRRKK